MAVVTSGRACRASSVRARRGACVDCKHRPRGDAHAAGCRIGQEPEQHRSSVRAASRWHRRSDRIPRSAAAPRTTGGTMQVAIVTGGSSGIGQSAAIQIAKRGTGVILTYNTNPAGALETVADDRAGRAARPSRCRSTSARRDLPGLPRAGRRGAARHWAAGHRSTSWSTTPASARCAMFEDTSEELFDRLCGSCSRARTS